MLGAAVALAILLTPSALYAAQENSGLKSYFIKKMMEKREEKKKSENGSDEGFYVQGAGQNHKESLGDRTFTIYTPPSIEKRKNIPLLIVLHGGFGSADQIHKYIGLNPLADKGNFIVAYLDGTQVASRLSDRMKGWNAGGCCGLPETKGVDDVSFIKNVIAFAKDKYGIDPAQVYGTGHSNGAMMTQRIFCETNLYKSAVSISGTLQLDTKSCPAPRGKNIMNIHGAQDENLPVAGGHTVVGFNKKTDYKSQEYTREIYKNSGARYDLLLLEGATHSPESINARLWETQNMSLPQKIVSYLGLE